MNYTNVAYHPLPYNMELATLTIEIMANDVIVYYV